jgi:hypothetical protein
MYSALHSAPKRENDNALKYSLLPTTDGLKVNCLILLVLFSSFHQFPPFTLPDGFSKLD